MTFRLANVAGRAALVDDQDRWFDLERLTAGGLPADPMEALADVGALHAAAVTLAGVAADGELASAALLAPVPQPRNADGVGAATKRFLQPGDVIVSTIEGIGTITNRCVA